MNNEEQQMRAEQARRMAKKIIEDSWLATGVTQQELDRDEQVMQVFSRLVASGRSEEDIIVEWKHKSAEEILRAYAIFVPAN